MQIKDITVYEKPKPFMAIQIDNNIHEVRLDTLFDWLCKQDTNLDLYSRNHDLRGYNLYNDLLSLGYPMKDKLVSYISSKEFKDTTKPIPRDLYPSVLRYYNGTADFKDMLILASMIGVDIIPPPDFPEGDITPTSGDITPPF